MDFEQELRRTLPLMNGWCTVEKGLRIMQYVSDTKPDYCVELGVFAGRSLIAFGLALARQQHGIVHGVDAWEPASATINQEDPDNATWWRGIDYGAMMEECQRVSVALGIDGFIELHKTTTLEALTRLPKAPIDILHIDGNHSEWDSCRDVLNWVPRVRDGGIIIFDDEDWNSTKHAQKFLLMVCEKIETIESTNLCGVYRKK